MRGMNQLVKYKTFDGSVVEAPSVLVKHKMRSHKCKCHHPRHNGSGICTFGKCKHNVNEHKEFWNLWGFF
jgi:hypothetical protein